MIIDLATTIQIAQVLMLLAGSLAALILLRNTVRSLKADLKIVVEVNEKQFAATQLANKEQFTGVQAELKKLGDILIGQARFDEKLISLDRRVANQERKIDELSHGEGFVRGRRKGSIDGEYSGV
jgi:hypothetical protein